jgi:hypothetical protein
LIARRLLTRLIAAEREGGGPAVEAEAQVYESTM